MAEIKVYGVKVPEELHAEAVRLQKEFGTGEDFLSELISIYKVEKTKELVPAVAEDLKELQSITRRMDNIFLNIANRMENLGKEKDSEYEVALQKKDNLISDFQGRNSILEEEKTALAEAYKNIVNEKNDANKKVNQLTNMYQDNKLLVEEYKGKNDMILSQLKQYEKYPEEVEILKGDLVKLQKVNTEIDGELTVKKQLINGLTERSSELVKSVDSLKTQHREEKAELAVIAENTKIQYIKEKEEIKEQNIIVSKKLIQDTCRDKDAEKRDEILKLKEEQQLKLQTLQDDYSTKIDEYQSKYKLLLEELEKAKEIQRTAVKKIRTSGKRTDNKPANE